MTSAPMSRRCNCLLVYCEECFAREAVQRAWRRILAALRERILAALRKRRRPKSRRAARAGSTASPRA